LSSTLAKVGVQVDQRKVINLRFMISLKHFLQACSDGQLSQDLFMACCSGGMLCGKLKRISVSLLSSVGVKSQS